MSAPDCAGGDRRRLGTRSLGALVDRAASAGLTVDLTGAVDRPDLPDAVDLAAYRIVQEGLTNALRHAGPGAAVRVCLAYSAQAVQVEVVDDGGRRPRAAAPRAAAPGGHGLIGMRERVAVFGGTLQAGPHGSGWRVAATLPLSAEPVARADPAEAA